MDKDTYALGQVSDNIKKVWERVIEEIKDFHDKLREREREIPNERYMLKHKYLRNNILTYNEEYPKPYKLVTSANLLINKENNIYEFSENDIERLTNTQKWFSIDDYEREKI